MDWEALYVTVEAIIAIVAFIGNSFVIVLFFRDVKLRLIRNYYLISLAFVNILNSLLAIPLTVLTYFGLPYNSDTLCYFELCIICIIRTLINYTIAAIALDRLKAITRPVEYRNNDSKRTFVISTSIGWSVAIIIGIFMTIFHVDGEECTFMKIHPMLTMIFSIIGKILPYVVVFSAYALIFWMILKVRKRREERCTSKSPATIRAQKREVRATLRISSIVGVLALCEMPLNTLNIVHSAGVQPEKFIVYSLLVLAHFHAAICPFLYAFNLKDFRKASTKILMRNSEFKAASQADTDS